jgi:hypothetical protein
MELKPIQVFQLSLEDLSALIRQAVASELQKADSTIQLNPTPETEILSREQTKDLLGISYVSLWKYNNAGILKARKIKGRVFYMRQDITNLLLNAS